MDTGGRTIWIRGSINHRPRSVSGCCPSVHNSLATFSNFSRSTEHKAISNSVMLTIVRDKYLWAVLLGWLGFAAAAAGESVIFSAMGCGPYTSPDKPAVALYVRQENRERTSEFMVHLGDVF